MKTERSSVYAAIDAEREYQDQAWPENAGTVENQRERTVAEELLMIEEYVAKARTAWTNAPRNVEADVTTNVLRKIAAIAVRAMENHGAPGREGFGVFVPAYYGFAPASPDDDIPF